MFVFVVMLYIVLVGEVILILDISNFDMIDVELLESYVMNFDEWFEVLVIFVGDG